MEKQKVVLINSADCSNIGKLNQIVKELLNHEGDLCSYAKDDATESHLWKADTKYYSADIEITILKKKSIMTEKFSESVEAVLMYFDSLKDSGCVEKMESWTPFIKTWEPSIKLAVCDKCDREGEATKSRVTMQEWCLEHEFELIELDPDMEDYDEFEDVGVKRIRNALLAHMWPNMEMKNPQNAVKKMPTPCGIDAAKSAAVRSETAQSRINNLIGKENEFDDVIGDETEQDNFEKLFCRLQVMKDQASSLPEADRKKYAENMVKAFWTALGGDDDELEGISSDEETKDTDARAKAVS